MRVGLGLVGRRHHICDGSITGSVTESITGSVIGSITGSVIGSRITICV